MVKPWVVFNFVLLLKKKGNQNIIINELRSIYW